ncbi:MAG: outer membrane beta-barrel protein [candidate division Zixibacteria bacterium]|nr:outer membrane beta-barrel protein [candidate division Zixibacteria bacterium]NIR68068.1 outer membrane beta-barrel protein [candidate division Zixibacteria bacterium]NIS16852.1 outer membrane beta-barrel protein [candidate division Zixibacteria bacterium]NIS49287.1 outer membrane beta-barrel protein [candidate division Zixibacteria bacterium]NIT53254.1 outer membrane beta-barrel protein [candidate division Zixibacteria bacterium]
MKKLLIIILLLSVLSSSVSAQIFGYLGGGLGATMPQGEFNEYTKTGFSIMGYGTIGMLKMPYVQLRLGLQGVFFEHDDRNVVFEGYPDDVFTETYTNDLLKATLGLELSKRLAAFEPYGGAGIGIYYFESKTELKDPDGEVIASNKLDSKTKFGWNLNGGIKIFMFPKVAFDFNLQYDIVQDLEQYSGEEVVSFNSEFLSLFAGVSIPLGVF